MKLNIILMSLGLVLFLLGAFMPFSCSKEKEVKVDASRKKSPEEPPKKIADTIPHAVPIPEAAEVADNSPKEKGNSFEDFVADILKGSGLSIKEWNKGSVTANGAFAENALNPDMRVVDKDTKINLEYWLECKYRSSIPDGGFSLKDSQLERYKIKQGESKRKVLILLGVGGSASSPASLYLVPLDSLIRYKHIPMKYLQKYRVADPKNLKREIRDYFFDHVFKKSK